MAAVLQHKQHVAGRSCAITQEVRGTADACWLYGRACTNSCLKAAPYCCLEAHCSVAGMLQALLPASSLLGCMHATSLAACELFVGLHACYKLCCLRALCWVACMLQALLQHMLRVVLPAACAHLGLQQGTAGSWPMHLLFGSTSPLYQACSHSLLSCSTAVAGQWQTGQTQQTALLFDCGCCSARRLLQTGLINHGPCTS
jgi:hypothetical protein